MERHIVKLEIDLVNVALILFILLTFYWLTFQLGIHSEKIKKFIKKLFKL